MKDTTQQIPDDHYFPTGFWRSIGDGISYRQYKHWGMNVWAGEGLYSKDGGGSGCLKNGTQMCDKPCVVEARFYRDTNGDMISALFSYPGGIGATYEYFWEIYPSLDGEPEWFTGTGAEQDIEAKVKLCFALAARTEDGRS